MTSLSSATISPVLRVPPAQGREEELRARADAGDWDAAFCLTELLVKQGRVEELRARAAVGDEMAAGRLGELLVDQGLLEEGIAVLGLAADGGDVWASQTLAELLAEAGREDELRARADAGDEDAASRLADLLAKQGRIEELRSEVDAGNPKAADHLIELLAEQGDAEQADRMRRFGLNPDGSIAAVRTGRMDFKSGTD